jgi:uncharacterized RDD family membrane protein YckC
MTAAPQALVTLTLAARRHRFAALLIDSLIFSMATSPIYLLSDEKTEVSDEPVLFGYLNPYAGDPNWPIEVVVTILLAVYFWLQHALWGRTLGKRLCRLKVVSSTTGELPSLRHAGIRALVYPALVSAPYLGSALSLVDTLWMFGDPKRRCLHDVAGRTIVIDIDNSRGFGGFGFRLGLGVLIALVSAFTLGGMLMAM